MQAVRIHEFGDPEVMRLEEVADLQAVDDEVLVRIQAVGVNPVESYVRSGSYANLPALPYTPGSDAAGVDVASGARVYVTAALSGTYAEYALCRPENVHPLPDSLSFAQGAALGLPYATAFRALFQRGRAGAGDAVLVHGASGGVGLAAVQFALAAGLTVVATAGSEAGLDLVAGQGVVRAVDHRDPRHLERALEEADREDFDVILEMRADLNLDDDLTALARRGRVVVVGNRGTIEIDPRRLMQTEGTITGTMLPLADDEERAETAAALAIGLRDGVLRPVVGRELPLAEAARAHHLLFDRPALGKIVLVV